MLNDLRLQDNGIPIYIQLRDQILSAIGRGSLARGAQLPTMRQVAVALGIDLNTVQRAYAELEREGVLTTMRGRGSFVAEAVRAQPARTRRKETQDFASRIAAQARAQGIALDELAAALIELAGDSS
jgi:GntR family transcriptional regulator